MMRRRIATIAMMAVVAGSLVMTAASAQDGSDGSDGPNDVPSLVPDGPNATATVVVDGTDRYDTAAQVALGTGERNVTGVLYIANGETLVDALVVGVANQGVEKILLVRRDDVPDVTEAALRQIAHAKLVFLGGDGVISPEVRDEVEALTCNYVTEGPCF